MVLGILLHKIFVFRSQVEQVRFYTDSKTMPKITAYCSIVWSHLVVGSKKLQTEC